MNLDARLVARVLIEAGSVTVITTAKTTRMKIPFTAYPVSAGLSKILPPNTNPYQQFSITSFVKVRKNVSRLGSRYLGCLNVQNRRMANLGVRSSIFSRREICHSSQFLLATILVNIFFFSI